MKDEVLKVDIKIEGNRISFGDLGLLSLRKTFLNVQILSLSSNAYLSISKSHSKDDFWLSKRHVRMPIPGEENITIRHKNLLKLA